MAKFLRGVVLIPTVSRNEKREFFHPDELPKFDGLTVPLRWYHGRDPRFGSKIIGTASFNYDKITQTVTHATTITDPFFQEYVDKNPVSVSFGAYYAKRGEEVRMCDKTGRCLDAPILGEIDDLSLVPSGGIAQASAKIIQSGDTILIDIQDLDMLDEPNASFNKEITSDNSMSDSKPIEKTEQDVHVHIHDSPKVAEATTEKVTESKTEEPKVEAKTEEKVAESAEVPKTEAKVEQSNEAKLIEKFTETLEKIQQNWTPQSEVAETVEDKVEQALTDDEADKILQKLDRDGYVKMVIDKEDSIAKAYSTQDVSGKVEQAVSTSGTIPLVGGDSVVNITLGGKTATPIRQFGQFRSLEKGTNTHTFYRITIPDAGAITESPTTDITAATHTITSVQVTCAIRGWRQTIEKAELEDYPSGFLNAIRDTARIEAVRDEHRLIVQDLGAADHDFGGTTTAPYHINLNDGSAITTATLEDAAAEADFSGVVIAKRLLQQLNKPALTAGTIIAFVSPRAFNSIASDTGLSEYTMVGNPQITRLGELERLWGIDFLVTNELQVSNNAYRNIFAVKGSAWGLCSQRNMEIEIQKMIAGQYFDLVWSHRIGVDVIEPNAYLIASSIES